MTKDVKPDWYKNLQTGPHRKKTFTTESMTRIERKLARKDKKNKRKRWLPIAALSTTAIVLVLGITLTIDRLPGITGPGPSEGNAGPGVTDPVDPPVGTNDPVEPPANQTPEGPPPLPDIEPNDSETLVELASIDDVMLSEALPFSMDDVTEVSVRTADGQELEVSQEGPNNLLTLLGQVFLPESRLDETSTGDEPQVDAMLRFLASDTLYAIPYASQANVMDLGAGQVYANGNTAREIYAVIYPDSAIAQFVQARNAVLSNSETGDEDRSNSYEPERLAVDGKTYYRWTEELAEMSAEVDLPYYTETSRLDSVRSYNEGAIISWDLLVAFTTDEYQTSDGISVGMTKDEVQELLGTPHIQTSLNWKYDVDNWDDLNLYFDGDVVQYVVMTTAD